MNAPTRPLTAVPPAASLWPRRNALSMALLRRRGAVLGLALVGVPLVALADLATGYELALSILYVLPVVAATWAFGLRAGLALSALATLAWLGTDALAQHRYSHAAYRYWEGFIRMATFVGFAVLIDRLRGALARSDDRLIRVLDGMDSAVCAIEPGTGDVLYRNGSFDAAFTGDARAPAIEALLEAALAAEGGPEATEERQVAGRWYLVRGRWLAWADGRPALLVAATDVTARREAEALNREQEARLQATARLMAVGEIASSIAHELNQPLAAIAGYVRGALRRVRAGRGEAQGLAGALEQAAAQAERAGEIIRRVRDYVQARQSRLEPIDINSVVARAASAAAHEGERSGLRIALRLDHRLPKALADAVMIEQVVLNLVRNAWEATRAVPASRPVEVATRAAEPAILLVTVSDRGCGVPPAVAPRLFEPFFTTKAGGMGLGLNICRSIVEFHGGRLWNEPREGGGTEFRFTIRAAPGP